MTDGNRLDNSIEEGLLLLLSRISLDDGLRGRLEGLLKAGVDWDYLMERAAQEGVSGMLYWNLRGNGLVPPGPFGQLRASFWANLYYGLTYRQELTSILQALNREGITPILFRGIMLIDRVYRQEGLRSFSDVDLLLRSEHLPRTGQVLRSLGYESLPAYPLLFYRDGFYLDLHTDPLGISRVKTRALVAQVDLNSLWAEAVATEIDGTSVLALSPCDEFLLLALHALKHSFRRLVWMVDMAELIRSQGEMFPWAPLLERAQRFGLCRPTYYALLYLHECLGVTVPPEVLLRLRPPYNWWERRVLGALLNGRGTEGMAELLYMASITKWSSRLRFLWETLFLDPEVRPQLAEFSSRAGFVFYPARLHQIIRMGKELIRQLL